MEKRKEEKKRKKKRGGGVLEGEVELVGVLKGRDEVVGELEDALQFLLPRRLLLSRFKNTINYTINDINNIILIEIRC